MSDRRRQPLCRLGPPESTQRHTPRSLRSRHPARAIAPSRGLFLLQRGAMSRRGLHRVTLPRTPRGLSRRARHFHDTGVKRALKHAAMRDCSRRCVYCAVPLALDVATLDHVYPVSQGGPHTPGNLVTACAPCNRLKGDMLPHEFFGRYPWAGANFVRYARAVHRALKRNARRAVSLAFAA